ncbi:MAG: glutaredoxin family protein [Mycobacteriales bacterium]
MSRLWRRRQPRPGVVTFVTRSGCQLCAEAEPVVRLLAADAGARYELRDVDANPADRARWTDHVPVVLLDGQEHSYWYVDEAKLRAALR